jgi:hypothetical protein
MKKTIEENVMYAEVRLTPMLHDNICGAGHNLGLSEIDPRGMPQFATPLEHNR